jgi:hypothetical protein
MSAGLKRNTLVLFHEEWNDAAVFLHSLHEVSFVKVSILEYIGDFLFVYFPDGRPIPYFSYTGSPGKRVGFHTLTKAVGLIQPIVVSHDYGRRKTMPHPQNDLGNESRQELATHRLVPFPSMEFSLTVSEVLHVHGRHSEVSQALLPVALKFYPLLSLSDKTSTTTAAVSSGEPLASK